MKFQKSKNFTALNVSYKKKGARKALKMNPETLSIY